MPGLWDAIQIGNCHLRHRVVMAPMTRLRADDDHIPTEMVVEYYAQRAGLAGTLLITESTFISHKSCGRDPNAPGIFTSSQIDGWQRVCDAIHQRGSFIFLQIWHVGRAAREHALKSKGIEMVSSSAVSISHDNLTPRAMTEPEIWECIHDFGRAAKNAIQAGFDGVEIHAANGYLIDQFTQDTCNLRTDQWGGSVENRLRFGLEVAKEVAGAIGADKTGVRLSPFNEFQGMGMKDPIPQFTHLITRLAHLNLAYLHLIEPRVSGNVDRDILPSENLNFAIKAWDRTSPILLAGGFTAASAQHLLVHAYPEEQIAIAFGRHFISNPDLPYRLMNKIPLTKYERDTFYKAKSREGYTDYTFSSDFSSSVKREVHHDINE